MTRPPAAADPALLARASEVVGGLGDRLRELLPREAGRAGSRAKSDGTPVTEMDLVADRTIRDALSAAFPDHHILSEEGDTVWRGGEWTWVVDPIDGTSNYTAGIPWWCVSIALLHHGQPVYGCIEAPPLATRFEAALGRGATRDGRAIHVADPVDFRSGRNAHVPFIVTTSAIRRASGGVRLNARILGSAALDLAMVADGTAVATYQGKPKAWDLAAGSLLVTEAGGAHLPVDRAILPPDVGTDLASQPCRSAAGPDLDWLRDLLSAM